jgi:zinc protease
MNARPIRLAALLAAALWALPPMAAADASGGFRPPAPALRTLDNGLTVAVFNDDRLPIVQIQLLVPAGSAQEPPGDPGVANLTVSMLSLGTASRTAPAFAAAIEALGGAFGGVASREFATVNGTFLAADFESGLELLADAALHPVFTEEQLLAAKQQIGLALQRARQNPAALAEEHLWATVYPGHPYGRSPQGAPNSLSAMGLAELRAFHRDQYRPDQALLAIAGDVQPERAFKAAEELLGSWGGRAPTRPPAAVPAPGPGWRVRIVDAPELARAELRIGTTGPARGADDFEALAVASEVFKAEAPDRIVRCGVTGLRDGGLFSLAATAPVDSVGAAVTRLRAALSRWTAEPAAEASAAPVRRRLAGGFAIQFETLGGLIAQWMAAAINGVPLERLAGQPERIAALSGATLHAAVARSIASDRMVLVAVGPAERLRPQLESIGPVEVVAPEMASEVAAAPSTSRGPPTAEERAKGRALADLAVAAHGGRARLQAIKDSNLEGTISMVVGPKEFVGQARQVRKEPMRFLFSTAFPFLKSVQVLDGDHAWSQAGELGGRIDDLDSLAAVGLRSGFRSDLQHVLLTAADPATRVAWRGHERTDERDADVLEVVAADGERRVLFLDVASHRLLAMEQSEGGNSARRFYRDFRQVNGIWWPFAEERLLNGRRAMSLTLQRVAFNTGVKDAIFRRPGATVAPAAPPDTTYRPRPR